MASAGRSAGLARTGPLDHRQATAARLASRMPYSMAAAASEAALPLIITEMTLAQRPAPQASTMSLASAGSSSMETAAEQEKALGRLAAYPRREQRLRQLWPDSRGGHERHTGATSSTAGSRSSSHLRQAGASVIMGGHSLSCTAARRHPRMRAASAAGRVRGNSTMHGMHGLGMDGLGNHADYFHGAFGGRLSIEQLEDLMTRDITPEDYEMLLCLDEGLNKARTLSSSSAAALPRPAADTWVGEDCRICLCPMEADEDIRALPTCSHVYHAQCAERWLATGKASCPICGAEVAEGAVG